MHRVVWTLFRLKIMLAGLCAVMAGPALMTSGIDGSMLTGGLITACGVGLICVTIYSVHIEPRKAAEIASPKSDGCQTDLPDSHCEHNWVNPDDPNDMLNYSYLTLRCTECGAERSAWG
jgi:hypothetical protein